MAKQAETVSNARLNQALAACKSDREKCLVLLSTKAGLRAVEIAGLTWSRVDLEERKLLLATTKGNKPRTVPMSRELWEALEAYRRSRQGHTGANDPVFVNTQAAPGKALTPNAVAVWFRDFYRRRLGWTGYSSHSGRRSFATNAAKKIVIAGGSLKDVQALLGHENLNTTQRYIETDEDAQRKVVDML
ncbi:MAG: tyrosine-type recombinase/integrase [Proteobacteria bacterium]|nr:tyrosine-type recombinase/integrase [Pseudomonadota bacterium]